MLRNSSLQDKFGEEQWRPFDKAVLLGDSGYPLKEWLQVPIASPNPSKAVENFNRSHKKTRRLIENAFGILKERFQCLKYMRVDPTLAGKVFMACCVLHNILLEDKPELDLGNCEEENIVILNPLGLESSASESSDADTVDDSPSERILGLRRQAQLLVHFQ